MVAKGLSQVKENSLVLNLRPHSIDIHSQNLTAFAYKQELFNLDANQAFIQTRLHELILVNLLTGYGEFSRNFMEIGRAFNGPIQLSGTWNMLLISALKQFDFQQCLSDPYLLGLIDGERVRNIVGFHVEDMMIVCSNRKYQWLEASFQGFPIEALWRSSPIHRVFLQTQYACRGTLKTKISRDVR